MLSQTLVWSNLRFCAVILGGIFGRIGWQQAGGGSLLCDLEGAREDSEHGIMNECRGLLDVVNNSSDTWMRLGKGKGPRESWDLSLFVFFA